MHDEDAVEDSVAAVIAGELSINLLTRFRPDEVAPLIADELMRAFTIQPRGDLPTSATPEDWPVLRHISVDRNDQAHIELATSPSHPRTTEAVTFSLPQGGRITVHCEQDHTVSEIVLSPASQLLPPDVRDEKPLPTTAADADGP